MALVNEHFLKLPNNYLFADISKKVNAFKVQHPTAGVISLGIGDVTRPLCPAVVEAIHKAADEMGTEGGFHGYGPEQGYAFLREAIVKNDFLPRGIHLDPSEIFVNDGAKSDTGNIQELVRWDNSIGVTDPIYPVYIDSNVMIGRAGVVNDGRWSNVVYMPCTAGNGFVPQLPDRRVDIIYLCYPNNPTGTVLSKDELRKWVNYALRNDTLIFFDAAYEAYIQNPDIPHSIYEIKGARKVAIEFHSYSKTAGFTGVRCGYTVVPKEVTAATLEGERISLHKLWYRRQCTKFNGASYISQRAAEATYTPEGATDHWLLHGERKADAQCAHGTGPEGRRGRGRALPVGADTRRRGQLAVLRADALQRPRGVHPRRGIRPERRGLRATDGLRRPRQLPRGARPDRPVARIANQHNTR